MRFPRGIGPLAIMISFVGTVSVATHAGPVRLRCEYRHNPLGIDTPAPHLSWQSDSTERNWKQGAYEILVASSPEKLARGAADAWDSGKTSSSESVGIAYGGPPLESRRRYYWAVRVWDSKGNSAVSHETAWWEMGLLRRADWKARWITRVNPEESQDRAAVRWIWVAGQDPFKANQVGTFHTEFQLRDLPKEAALFVLARGEFAVRVNGIEVGGKKHWHEFDREDITGQLHVGTNSLDVTATPAAPDRYGAKVNERPVAALAALIKIWGSDGSLARIGSDAGWKSRLDQASPWQDSSVLGSLEDPRFGPVAPLPEPAACLRREFQIAKPVRSARIYATALGSYRLSLNGAPVAGDVLAPGFTDYSKRIQYQTYDVTALLRPGSNAVGAILGAGWFASGMTWDGVPYFFAPPPVRFLAQLEITYADGTRDVIATDEAWKTHESPILRSEIYAGELYDARDEIPGWDEPGFGDARWGQATRAEPPSAALSSQADPPVTVVASLAPKSVSRVGGSKVFDLGQNIVGWARLHVTGAAGTRVRLRFAERLNPDGSIYTENLRNAGATDTYVLRGSGEESFAPHFTFHGFRYVELTAYPSMPQTADVTGEVVSSLGGEPTARVHTASDLVDRMWGVGIWGQRGNFLSIPTDCPQRDERLGWMGDAGAFWRTGAYNFGIAPFSRKFVQDIMDAQMSSGAFTNVSPDSMRPNRSLGAPGWADAGIIIPWTAWLQYGDRELVARSWNAMQRYMQFIAACNQDFIRRGCLGPNFGDWLAPDSRTDKTLLATAYWALDARMMAQMARGTGRENGARRYEALFAKIRAAFQAAYIRPDGEVANGTQASYVVTLYAGLAPAALAPKLTDHLAADIEARGGHLSTGFLATPFLLFVLADHGRTDLAYRLLLNTTYPSWGYMLEKGATTWWERWNGDTGDPAMNSYNHYAFGSVVAWIYRYLAGIDTSPGGPGFQHIVIHPHPDPLMTHGGGEYESVYGKITTNWTSDPGRAFSLKVTVPANTSATICLPAIVGAHVTEDGHAIGATREHESFVAQTGSGSYTFEVAR